MGLIRLFPRAFILFLAGYTTLAQPGLPPCWVEKHACESHPHFSRHQAETSHSHEYLFDLSQSQVAQDLSPLLFPVSLLLAALFTTRILRKMCLPVINRFFWIDLFDPPPPRFFYSI
jgi:hypothetical protein